MGKNNMNTIFVLAVLFTALFTAGAYALPDNPPTCSLSSNTYDTETTAVLTVVSVDTLENAGVDTIRIFEGGSQISSKSCAYANTCVSTKTVIKTAAGDYSYYAICRDRSGQQTTSGTITVHFDGSNLPPVIDTFSPATPLTVGEDQTTNFRITAHDPDGDSMTYEWKVDGVTVGGETGTSYNFQRSVSGTSQSYTIAVYVRDGKGGVDVQTWSVTVRDLVPRTDLHRDSGSTECDTFTFDADVDSYDPISSYSWNFGDGTVASGGETTTHRFAENGTYTVTVTVTDSDGDVVTESISVAVQDVYPAVNAGPDQTVAEGTPVNFSGTATMPCRADTIINYTWSFGDGTTASGQTATHTYTEDGTYTVTFTVCDEDGCRSDTLVVTVTGTGPSADFSYAPASPVEGDDVQFNDESTSFDPIVSWSWDLDGDGTVDSTEQDPDWTYLAEGDYTVCLTVTDDDGDSDTHCETIHIGNNAPSVDLVANVTSGGEGLDVHFDCSVAGGNPPYSFLIDFGDGTSVSAASADYTYSAEGDYTVTCTVTDSDGDSGSDSLTISISNDLPEATLVLNTTLGTEPLSVMANCSAALGNEPYSFSIDFGDGTVVNSASASHTYIQDGNYHVVCTVTDVDGDVGTSEDYVDVLDSEPTADFVWDPEFPEEGENVSFDGTADAYDTPVTIEWDFGDGDTSSGEDVTHAFAPGGDYDVTMTVTDADGSEVSVTHTVHVSENPPEAELYVDPLSGDEPLTVDVNCTSIGGDAPLDYEIDFGDGSGHFFGPVASHTYAQNGTYNITCTVTDIDTDESVDSEVVEVFDTEPVIGFTYSPASPDEGETVDFEANISAYDMPVDIEWDFGDGDSDTVEDPSHVYATEGIYTVTLTVTDADGSEVSVSHTVTVGPNAADVMLVANETSGYEPLTVEFGCAAIDGNAPFTYDIDFGDGTAHGTLSTETHTFEQNGTYVVNCTVTDTDGDVSSDSVTVTVLDTVPEADFTHSPADPVEGDDVDFDSTVSAYDMPVDIEWDFGDGATSTEDDPTHSYAAEGDYNVTLTATDADGSVVVVWHVVSVGNNEPFVNLLADPLLGPEGVNVTFNCTVSDGNAPLSFSMDYGDGTFGADQDSVHQYNAPGSYVATCTVTDDDGDSDSDFVIINVANNAPVVNLTASPLPAAEGEDIDFDCGITGGDEPLTVVLDFGDGTTTTTPTATHSYAVEGVYTAACTVVDVDGDIGFDDLTVTITDNEPVVNLVVNTTSGLEPLSVEYNCTVGAGNEPFSYLVDFGDGTTSSSATGTHDYPNPGVYSMTCTVTDADGDWDDDTVGIHVANNPPVVDLIAVPTAGLEGIDVVFTCNVTGGNAPIGVVLDFGDGTSTASATATHNYPLEGIYNATCTATDLDGDVGSDSELVNISNNPPTVNLMANVTSGLEPLTVLFNCTVGGGNLPFVYSIDFGDGSAPVADSTAVHTYPTEGDFDATCTVTDFDGDFGIDIEHIEVLNNPPVVDLIAVPAAGLEGLNVSFTCNVSGGNAPFAYSLDFGDGTSTAESSAWHVYPLEGVYTATCQVVDFDGDMDSDSELINISNNPPVVNLAVNATSGLEPLSVNYTCNVGGGNLPFVYVIDFGDGSPSSSSPVGTHDYPVPGTYVMTCGVSDVDGDSDSDDVLITVIDNPPVVDLIVVPAAGLEGINVSFNCSVAGGNAPIGIVLDFGDGTSTTDAVATHNYPLEGLYNATCTATDFDGDVDSDSELINISNNVPVVNLVSNVTDGEEPLSVFFNCTLVGGGNPPFTYSIDFGDGSAPVAASTASHTYLHNSTYDASCTITDTDGDVSVPDVLSVDVFDSEPDANFSYSPSSPIEGDLISFTDLSTAYDGIVAWSWNFGDGNTSSVMNPTHTYYVEGVYIVTLTVTDGDGSETSHVVAVAVGNNAPVADVTVAPLSGTEPLTVAVDCGVVSGGNAPFSYLVLYGDGASTTTTASVHTYAQDGLYPVVCQITDNDGDVSSDVQNVLVNDTAPVADFTFAPAGPRADETVNFTDLSTAYDGIASWAWDFENDGVVDSVVQNATHVFASPGLYIVNLSVTDSDGSTAWTIRTVAVNISIPAPIIFNVQAVGITNTSANITWGTDQAADSEVEYSIIMGAPVVVNDAALVFNHNLLLSGLTPNTTYYYAVASCNTFGVCTSAGTYNFTTGATVIPDLTPPGDVSGLGESGAGSDWIQWSWTNPADADFDHVEVWVNGSFVANTSGTSYNVTGLSPSTEYAVEIITVDTTGNRNTPGTTDSASTTAGADLTPPAPVTGLGETAVGADWINWAWTNPSDLDFNHVELWLNGTNIANTSGSSYNVTGLSANTTYELTLVTVDNVGNRNTPGVSDSATTSTGADLTAPGPVSGLGETAVGADWINWAWTNPSDVDFNHVELWLNGTNVANTSGTSYNATGLAANATYQLTVITVDNVGNRNTPGVSDSASTNPADTVPVVTASASPNSGLIPLMVQFNATVMGGEAPISFAWDFNSDGIVDSTLQNPLGIYNLPGVYTATVNVTDVDGDWDTDSVAVTASGVTHDVAVLSVNYTKEGRTVYLYDNLQVNASVANQGAVSETFNLQLEIDGVVVANQVLTLGSGASTLATFNWSNVGPEGFRTVLVRAVPVAGEGDLSDNSATKTVRVWSVDDIVSSSTRYIVYWAGSAYVPVGNAYVHETFYDLQVQLTSPTAVIGAPALRSITLLPSETQILVWTVAAIPGDVLTAVEGNNEVTFSTTV
jgi:PKD repeat protein